MEVAALFGSNVLLALLINPWKFQVFADKGKKLPTEKPKHIWVDSIAPHYLKIIVYIWAKIGYERIAKVARARVQTC